MARSFRLRKHLIAGALSVATVGAFVLPAVTASASPALPAAASTTVKATTTTVKATTGKWEVVAGVFASQKAADAQVAALKKAGFKGFAVKAISPKFAVVKVNLSKTNATALKKAIDAKGGLGSVHLKLLA
jgi:cell division septation protein DedD